MTSIRKRTAVTTSVLFVGGSVLLSPLCWAKGPSDLTDSRYDTLRQHYLDIDPSYYSEIDFTSLSPSEKDTLLFGGKDSTLGLKINERPGTSREPAQFGARHWCQSSAGQDAVCWFSTGGKDLIDTPDCGTPTGDNYQVALESPVCNEGTWSPWYGSHWWLNARDGDDYVSDGFPNASNMPLNRLCMEFELPFEQVMFDDEQYDIATQPELSQIINPDVLHPNLREIPFGWGTYTAPFNSEGKTTDEEVGGTFQGGGTHFYHRPTSYSRIPTDRAFAIDERTIVTCIGPYPTGVRSGMRPAYVANPLMTLAGSDSEGITNAYSYINYLTRVYISWRPPEQMALYPLDIKLTRTWVMYEKNDVFAMSGKGEVLGVDMIEAGQTAYYPFTIYNAAKEDREYRLFMNAGEVLPFDKVLPHFVLYEDKNKNGVVDSNEQAPFVPGEFIRLTAQTGKSFIAAHRPDFSSNDQTYMRYNRTFAQGTIMFLEKDRMRSASYAVRTWQGSKEDLAIKDELLADMVYPAPDSHYALLAEYNEAPSNPRLIRNSPDFIHFQSLLSPPVAPIIQSIKAIKE